MARLALTPCPQDPYWQLSLQGRERKTRVPLQELFDCGALALPCFEAEALEDQAPQDIVS